MGFKQFQSEVKEYKAPTKEDLERQDIVLADKHNSLEANILSGEAAIAKLVRGGDPKNPVSDKMIDKILLLSVRAGMDGTAIKNDVAIKAELAKLIGPKNPNLDAIFEQSKKISTNWKDLNAVSVDRVSAISKKWEDNYSGKPKKEELTLEQKNAVKEKIDTIKGVVETHALKSGMAAEAATAMVGTAVPKILTMTEEYVLAIADIDQSQPLSKGDQKKLDVADQKLSADLAKVIGKGDRSGLRNKADAVRESFHIVLDDVKGLAGNFKELKNSNSYGNDKFLNELGEQYPDPDRDKSNGLRGNRFFNSASIGGAAAIGTAAIIGSSGDLTTTAIGAAGVVAAVKGAQFLGKKLKGKPAGVPAEPKEAKEGVENVAEAAPSKPILGKFTKAAVEEGKQGVDLTK